mmetsp:Transcript_25194/g.54816  ORF Transcript_25194/g.54816 Transcript_25194/m.54816 type:complete len:403 (-) Transcript_25194:364-1572(-)
MASRPMRAQDKECYMCMMPSSASELICPCVCRSDGQPRYVHRHCLDRWRKSTRDPRYFTHCRECGFQFRYIQRATQGSSDAQAVREARKQRVIGGIVRNSLLGIVAGQCVLLLLAMLIRAMDPDEALVKFWNLAQLEKAPATGTGTYLDAIKYHKLTYYLSALVLALFLVGLGAAIFGICSMCVRCCRSTGDSRVVQTMTFSDDPFMNYLICDSCCRCTGDCAELCCVGHGGDARCCEGCGDLCSQSCSSESCTCEGCNSSDCSCQGDQNCGQVLFVFLVAIVLALVFVGFVVIIMVLVSFIQRSWAKYLQVTELRYLTTEFVVEDLSPLIENPPLAAAQPVPVVQGVEVQPGQLSMNAQAVHAIQLPPLSAQGLQMQEQAFHAVEAVHGRAPPSNPHFRTG